MYYRRQKKLKFHDEHSNGSFVPGVTNYSNPFALPDVLHRLEDGKYGSVTKEYEALHTRRMQVINLLSSLQQPPGTPQSTQQPPPQNPVENGTVKEAAVTNGVADPCSEQKAGKENASIIVIDSDDENEVEAVSPQPLKCESGGIDIRAWVRSTMKERLKAAMAARNSSNTDNQLVPYGQGTSALVPHIVPQASWQPSVQIEKVVLQKVSEETRAQDLLATIEAEKRSKTQVLLPLPSERRGRTPSEPNTANGALPYQRKRKERKSEPSLAVVPYVSLQENAMESPQQAEIEEEEAKSDGLEDLWKDMSLAMESSKIETFEEPTDTQQMEEEEDCNHSIVLQDDIGLVCRVCGVIQKRIETIFDYQWKKGTRARSYYYDQRTSKDGDDVEYAQVVSGDDFVTSELTIHPRHSKQMKPHQLEGFNFLVKNLVSEKPGGCILAHAPGSGKTFMLISFIQSFLAKYPSARPLVVLPKGILPTWKREFERWQVEDIPLYDFYSVKAEKRTEQLEVLNTWQEKKSILFLGYVQFSTIISRGGESKVAEACRERLLKVPSLLILDEGHTPRNQDTDVLESLLRVQTPRKVVLSGTLFQNHVKEVFNILDLVRPKFLKMESSRAIVRRIKSQVVISGGRRVSKSAPDSTFHDLVEDTLQNDDNLNRKVNVIKHLREMTKDVLHYYKGDFLDELPGLVDFTVHLKLSPKQKDIIRNLPIYEKFKRSAVSTSIYMHPCLLQISEVAAEDRSATLNDAKIDHLIESINVKEGVKAKFFLNLMSLAESAGEKVLVFSQYILPLKFLERLLVKERGWRMGKEILLISGDSSPDDREWSMEHFNKSPDAKILFGSIKACGEGISLVGASRVVILDVHLNPSVTRQAIGRAFRPGQEKKVYVYRLVAADSPEVQFHETAFKKEVIPKMWFEWSEYSGLHDFKLEEVDVESCGDNLLETPVVRQDVQSLYKR